MTDAKEKKPKEKKPKKVQTPVIDAHDAARRQALGAAMFQALCNEIDNAPEVTALTKARFQAMQFAEAEQTDVTIHCLNVLRNEINRSLELAKMYADAAKRMTATLDSAEETILAALDGNNAQRFKGTVGDLKIVSHGGKAPLRGPAVDVLRDVHYGNVIDASTAFELGVPDEFLIPVELSLKRLDKDAIRAAIEAGEDFTFARIEGRGRRLGGPFIKVGIMELNTVEGEVPAAIEGGENAE